MTAPPLIDPAKFVKWGWPDTKIYRKQREALDSLVHNYETVLVAGNMLGKDYIASFGILYFFLTRHPCRIVTTSAKDDHLKVLWGEVGQRIQTCRFPLLVEDGGPLLLTHQNLKKVVNRKLCPLSYVTGLVANDRSIAAMQGHHVADTGDGVPRTLFVVDEASSVPDSYYNMAITWARRVLILGNPWPCENFFRRAEREGDIPMPEGGKLIHPSVPAANLTLNSSGAR